MNLAKGRCLIPPSKVVAENRLRFFGHKMRRTADRPVQRALRILPDFSWKRPPDRTITSTTMVVKEEMRILGVDIQVRRDVGFRRIWNSDEWIDSVQTFAKDREVWPELCARTNHVGKDAGISPN
ncbi:hypothetical protein RB195_003999 [Necator americanus]|uniref:Uncharacterized protein n=1 Tax=Necator americanus TaxID=51031 RepID=A0ABR1DSN9_NECAM